MTPRLHYSERVNHALRRAPWPHSPKPGDVLFEQTPSDVPVCLAEGSGGDGLIEMRHRVRRMSPPLPGPENQRYKSRLMRLYVCPVGPLSG